MIRIKRVYDDTGPRDGTRYLVERLWPRGMRKEDLHAEAWLKDVAPSPELRRWFNHDPARWGEFQKRYRAELRARIRAALGAGAAVPRQELRPRVPHRRLTFAHPAPAMQRYRWR